MNMLSDQELEYRHLGEVSSTNDYLHDYQPHASITVVTADYQTRGRGQVGNTWVSNRGQNLLFSVLVSPPALRAGYGFVLSQAMALAIRDELLRHIPNGISIKWPNDIYCHGRKICGTLIENTLSGSFVARSVIGSGINVNQTDFPSGLAVPPTSLQMELGHAVDVEELLQGILRHFRAYYGEVQCGEYARIRQLYHDSLYMKGKLCTFRDSIGLFQGTILHVEPGGHLVIRDASMHERRYAFKEVKLVRNG